MQTRYARLRSLTDARLPFVQGPHREDTNAAAGIEARPCLALLAIPGMDVASATEITGASGIVVRRHRIADATNTPE